MIGPKLEHAQLVPSLHIKKHIRTVERIQRIATRLVPKQEKLTYKDRLKEIKLITMEEGTE